MLQSNKIRDISEMLILYLKATNRLSAYLGLREVRNLCTGV
jgi:hypothetical protein